MRIIATPKRSRGLAPVETIPEVMPIKPAVAPVASAPEPERGPVADPAPPKRLVVDLEPLKTLLASLEMEIQTWKAEHQLSSDRALVDLRTMVETLHARIARLEDQPLALAPTARPTPPVVVNPIVASSLHVVEPSRPTEALTSTPPSSLIVAPVLLPVVSAPTPSDSTRAPAILPLDQEIPATSPLKRFWRYLSEPAFKSKKAA